MYALLSFQLPLLVDDDSSISEEGEFYRESGIRKNDRRYYSLYEVDRKGKVMDKRCFPYDTFESRSAVDVFNGKLYFLKKTLDLAGGEESHSLCVYE